MNNDLAPQDQKTFGLQSMVVLLGCVLPIQIMGRAAIAGAIVLAFLCFLSLPQKAKYLKRIFEAVCSPVGVLLLITFILWLPNVFLSIDPLRSLEAGVRTFVFIGLAAFFWAVLVENKSVHGLLLRTFVLASTVAIIIALTAEIALPELYWFVHLKGWLDVPVGTSLKPFSALAIFMIPVFLWIGFRLKGVWIIFALANSIGFVALVWLTYNRATIAGLVAMLLLVAGLVGWSGWSRRIKVVLPVVAAAVLIGVLIWLSITRQRSGLEGEWFLPLWLIDFQRQEIWRFAFELAMHNIWFGMGINTINFSPGADAVIPHTVNLARMPGHPHNWILEVLAETGIFGLLSLLFVIAMSLFDYCKSFIQKGSGAYLVVLCMSIGYWMSGLFNFSFWSSWWQMSFVLITAICLSQKSHSDMTSTKGV